MGLFIMLNRFVVMLLIWGCFFAAGEASAQQDWQAEEKHCVAKCPAMPRFGGVETDAQYHARMRQQARHDQCFLECARRSSSRFKPSFVSIDEAAKAYYRRNGVTVGP